MIWSSNAGSRDARDVSIGDVPEELREEAERRREEMIEGVERFLLIEALREHGNNKTQTAATLGITREGLHKKLSKHGI